MVHPAIAHHRGPVMRALRSILAVAVLVSALSLGMPLPVYYTDLF